MKGLKRTLTVFTVMLVSLMLVTACSKKRDIKGEVTIEFWEQDGAEQQVVLDKLIAEFQKENSNIKVKRVHHETEDLRKNYTSAAIGGGGPDVVLGPNDNLGVFVPGDLVVPASDVMGDAFFKDFESTALEASKYAGKQYMVPDRNGNELIMIYNKAFVKEAPKTWEELEKVGAELKKTKGMQYTIVWNLTEPFWTVPFLGAFGGKVFDDVNAAKPKPTLNTEAMKQTFIFLKDLQVRGVIPKEADYDVASNLFKEEKTAFLINGPWSFGDYQAADMNIGIAPIPQVKGKYPAPYTAVKGYTISQTAVKDDNKKEAVRRFVEFMTNKESQLKMSASHAQAPSLKTALADKQVTGNPMISGQSEQLKVGVAMPIITEMRAIWDAMKPVQQEVYAGKVKPEEAPAKIQKRAEDGVKALGK